MDVLRGSSKSGYGLYRRRVRVDTPEINTYHRQILFCEKKCDKLNQKFHIPEPKHDVSFSNKSVHKSLPTECWSNSNSLVSPRRSRKNSLDNYHAGLSRRKSSFQAQADHKELGPSHKLDTINRASPQKYIANRPSERRSSENRAVTRDVLHHDKKQSRRLSKSKLHSESNVRNVADKDRPLLGESDGKQDQNVESGEAVWEGSTIAALEEVNCALRKERDHFLRALTTLAINRITTEKPNIAPIERNTTFTHYERNIDLLADGSRLTLNDDHMAPHLANDNKNKDGSSASSSSGSDIYGPVQVQGENVEFWPDKRERINRLRSYLKFSGFGNPNMIRTTTKQSEDEKRCFSRLIRRINRGLSYEKQERLRRKAQLEYEMSLMKGESFCEQQEQAYMRTASADMENRDVQLLEEELRIQALREIRQSKKETVKNPKTLARQHSSRFDLLDQSQSEKQHGHRTRRIIGGEATVTDDKVEAVEKPEPEVDEKSSSDDRDAMSGLIRNPVSRREMKKRILMWVYDVEEATGASQKDGEKLEKRILRNDSNSGKNSDNLIHQDKSNTRDLNVISTADE